MEGRQKYNKYFNQKNIDIDGQNVDLIQQSQDNVCQWAVVKLHVLCKFWNFCIGWATMKFNLFVDFQIRFVGCDS